MVQAGVSSIVAQGTNTIGYNFNLNPAVERVGVTEKVSVELRWLSLRYMRLNQLSSGQLPD